MNWELVEQNWHQFKGTVRARWSRFTPENLEAIGGRRPQLLNQITETYGIKRMEAEREIQAFEMRNKDYKPKS